ncbi:hypothetical protein D915_000883 [Fasciola hepatica]|uniref:Uncharacterized protein n=1 Tax=Fasciola hepatica TaxID=6192 RepID=A0A4E0RLG4_FASHE|nr:hypothetical protein D915_000883 [Fasciola hepatica]
MTSPNDGNRTPTPMQVLVYTDEKGWTQLDPNVPIAQQTMDTPFFSTGSTQNDQSGFRAMYVESSVTHSAEQPQQRGMMISSGLPPMNTQDGQGVPQTPMQTLMFHSNQPFAKIPPPPGFENFPAPMNWGPCSLPMPPMFTDGRPGENRSAEFAFPPTIPGFQPPTPPMPMPWPSGTNMGPTVVTTVHTTTTTATQRDDSHIPPPPPPQLLPGNLGESANMNQNMNNTMEIWRLRNIPNQGGKYAKSDTEIVCPTSTQYNGSSPNSRGDILKTDLTDDEQPLCEFNSQNSQQDLNQFNGPVCSVRRSHKKSNCRPASSCGQCGASHRKRKPDILNRPNAPINRDQLSPSSTHWMMNQHDYTLPNPTMCFYYTHELPQDQLVYPLPRVNLPSDGTSFHWKNSYNCPYYLVPSTGVPTTSQMNPIHGNPTAVPPNVSTLDKATSTDERVKRVKSHKTVWGLVMPLTVRPLQHEVFTEQSTSGEYVENWATVDLNAMHPIQMVQPTELNEQLQPGDHVTLTSLCGCDGSSCGSSESTDSLLTTFLNVTSKKFDRELHRLESAPRYPNKTGIVTHM